MSVINLHKISQLVSCQPIKCDFIALPGPVSVEAKSKGLRRGLLWYVA